MPTIIVLADAATDGAEPRTHLHEHVPAELLIDSRATGELVQRIVLALVEAEQTERERRAEHAGHGCGCGVAHAAPT